MNHPADLMYTKTHEWVRKDGEGQYTLGLTDHAQSELGDLVFISLPAVGDALTSGESFADVESVKAVSEVYSPFTGTVAAANELLLDEPGLVNDNCYDAWFIKAENVNDPGSFLSAAEYEAMLAQEA